MVAELRERLADQIMAGLAAWPPGEAEEFARQLRRFTAAEPFAP
ncbi:hypothetical protein ACFV5G_37300 [Streptomyces sp. NPDC059766]